jgi:hypothetical protein
VVLASSRRVPHRPAAAGRFAVRVGEMMHRQRSELVVLIAAPRLASRLSIRSQSAGPRPNGNVLRPRTGE